MKLSTKIKKIEAKDRYDFAIKVLELIGTMPVEGPEHNSYYDVQNNIEVVKESLKELV